MPGIKSEKRCVFNKHLLKWIGELWDFIFWIIENIGNIYVVGRIIKLKMVVSTFLKLKTNVCRPPTGRPYGTRDTKDTEASAGRDFKVDCPLGKVTSSLARMKPKLKNPFCLHFGILLSTSYAKAKLDCSLFPPNIPRFILAPSQNRISHACWMYKIKRELITMPFAVGFLSG